MADFLQTSRDLWTQSGCRLSTVRACLHSITLRYDLNIEGGASWINHTIRYILAMHECVGCGNYVPQAICIGDPTLGGFGGQKYENTDKTFMTHWPSVSATCVCWDLQLNLSSMLFFCLCVWALGVGDENHSSVHIHMHTHTQIQHSIRCEW